MGRKGPGRAGGRGRGGRGGRTGGRGLGVAAAEGAYAWGNGVTPRRVGGGGGRKRRQIEDAYAGRRTGPGRRIRAPESSDSDDSEDDLPGFDEEEEETLADEEDPNVERQDVMRVGGVVIHLNDRGRGPAGGRGAVASRRAAPVDDDEDDEEEDEDEGSGEWESGSELSLDSDAVSDYIRNCMDGDGSESDEEFLASKRRDDDAEDAEDDDAAEDDDDDEVKADAAVTAAEAAWEDSERRRAKRRAREASYLRNMSRMNLDGGGVPSPPASVDDSESEEENDALVSGGKGTQYAWGTGGARVTSREPERLGPSGRRAAKKAAKAASKRNAFGGGGGDRDERDSLPRAEAVADAMSAMIRSGAAYMGFQPTKSMEALQGLAHIAGAFGLSVEVRGGGKRRHPVVHWTHKARLPREDDARLLDAIARAGGGGGKRGGGNDGGVRRDRAAPNFVSAGILNDEEIENDETEIAPFSDANAEIQTRRDAPDDADDAYATPGLGGGMDAAGAGDDAGVEPTEEEPKKALTNRGLRRAAEHAEREKRILERERRKRGLPVDAKPGGKHVVAAGHQFGAFEKHTSGFGSKMLRAMGYQGEGTGVGPGGTGIAEPIAAEMRKKRVGLGAENTKKSRTRS